MIRLEEIAAYKRQEVADAKRARPAAQLERALKQRPPVRGFQQAIRREGSLSLIAEVKRASPSAGQIRPGADAVSIAKSYAQAGAQAISVLTDSKFFSGSLGDLTAVKEAVALPILRKDFLLEEYHLLEAAAAGADALLLIVAILEPQALRRLLVLTRDLSLDALVEVHTERELGEALEAGAGIVGINNRDLATLEVELKTTERLIRRLPGEKTAVSESGIRSRADLEFIRRQGVHAVLIGEELMSAGDIVQRVKELMGWKT
ncbi:MAG: indole-3-glycerol phosphate synthase TrpC [Candidatus Omnitrophica bacterium]|nr:indole-3-glycerol phosphate synthase TrpC [Candidatus Omnitrophota bacterium]